MVRCEGRLPSGRHQPGIGQRTCERKPAVSMTRTIEYKSASNSALPLHAVPVQVIAFLELVIGDCIEVVVCHGIEQHLAEQSLTSRTHGRDGGHISTDRVACDDDAAHIPSAEEVELRKWVSLKPVTITCSAVTLRTCCDFCHEPGYIRVQPTTGRAPWEICPPASDHTRLRRQSMKFFCPARQADAQM